MALVSYGYFIKIDDHHCTALVAECFVYVHNGVKLFLKENSKVEPFGV